MNLVLLAAGNSSRFKQNKLLYELNGKPLICYAAELAMKTSDLFSQIILVTQYKEIALLMENYKGIKVIFNHEPDKGISYSIQCSLSYIGEKEDVMFCVCDQPFLKEQTVRALYNDFLQSNKGLAAVKSQSGLGNPAIFSSCYRKELLALTGDVGGKRIILSHLEDTCITEIEEQRELKDIDYLSDL